MKRSIFTLMLICTISVGYGQGISRQQADSILKTFRKNDTSKDRIYALLKLAEFNIYKPGEFKADLDSAEQFIAQAEVLNNSLRSMAVGGHATLVKAYLNRQRYQNTAEKASAEKAIDILKTTDDKFHLALAYVILSDCYDANDKMLLVKVIALNKIALSLAQQLKSYEQKGQVLSEITDIASNISRSNYSQRITFLQSLAPLIYKINNEEYTVWLLKETAMAHFYQGDVELAKSELLKILSDHKEASLCEVYQSLAIIYQQVANYKQSLYYQLKSINSVKTTSDSLDLGNYYAQLSNIYLTLDMKDKCIEALKKCKEMKVLHKRFDGIWIYIKQIAVLTMLQGRPQEGLNYILAQEKLYPPININSELLVAQGKGQCYTALKKYATAEKYFLKMINLSNQRIKRGEIKSDFASDYFIGLFYVHSKQYQKAKVFLEKCLTEIVFPEVRTSDAVRKVYLNLFKVDSASGNYLSAIKRLQFNQQLKDSIFDIAKTKQIQDLQVSYETEQKKKDISLLKSDQKLQLLKLRQTQNTRNWTIATAIVLLLLLAVSYNQFRLKQSKNKLLELKQEEIARANKKLQLMISQKDHLLKEKEWLLKEVHHRVKNNLHTVICLLESQAIHLENDALKAIEDSQHRIFAMSLIHQKLYQSDDIKTIDMASYMPEFIQYLKDSLSGQTQVRFHLAVEPIKLGVSQAIPVALIINEAVTNSVKYAFKPGVLGNIFISMYQKDNNITLMVADDGVGIGPDIAAIPLESLGLRLMNGLSEDINAEIKFENDHGTRITVIFNIDPLHDEQSFTADREMFAV